MRVHRSDDPDDDEPVGGWVEASPEGPSATLADVLQTWTVVRRWRGVKARTAAEAIEKTHGVVGVEEGRQVVVQDHDQVNATRGGMYLLYHTADELQFIADELGNLFDETVAALAHNRYWPEEDQARARARMTILNSLRTQFAEAATDAERGG